MLLPMLLAALLTASFTQGGEDFDWKRDRIVFADGREERGFVVEAFHPEHVVVMRSPGSRDEIPRRKIQRVDLLRERLASFLRMRRPGLALAAEWSLVEDAQRVGLTRMARLQAYHVVVRDPDHVGAHEFLGHKRAGNKWKWTVDEEKAGRERYQQGHTEAWDRRLILQSEHFVVETDCGLRRAVDVLFDLEALYVWWMQHLGPELWPTEDVDDPYTERIVFQVHASRFDPEFEVQTSDREPYYTTSAPTTVDSEEITQNLLRTYYEPRAMRPERLFELASESLLYSLLVLGKTRERAVDDAVRRPSAWAERGLADWVAGHCGGEPGYVQIPAPFTGGFALDPALARLALEPLEPPHPLLQGRSELKELVRLTYANLHGTSSNVPRARARAASFVAFVLEVDPRIHWTKGEGSGRAAMWHYLREVYGTVRAQDRDAFDDGLGGAVERLQEEWWAWTAQQQAR